MAKQRNPIPEDVAALVLFRSDRRCCVCRELRKAVQIHHIDEDPANSDPDNLAVLCLECHNQTQVEGGFGRRLDAAQVHHFRAEWHRQVELERALLPAGHGGAAPGPQPDGEARRAHDRDIFVRAQQLMSEDALEGFLEPLWNGDEYYWKYFLLVRSYVGFLAAADNELLDDELSSRCEAMRRSFDLLFDFIAYNFFPFGEKDATERLVMHPRLNVDRGGSGDPKDMSEYWRHQKKLYQIVNGAYESWREFRRAVKRTLVV